MPGRRRWTYEEVVAACRRGEYPHTPIRAASGRENLLLGVAPKDYALMEARARESGAGLALIGSRVSGPRLRQRTLHPVLAHCLPLRGASRAPSALYAGVDAGLDLDKTVIKDYGREDHDSSDLGVVLLSSRPPGELDGLAAAFEAEFSSFSEDFPVRVYSHVRGSRFADEPAFVAGICAKLRGGMPAEPVFSDEELAAGFREVYALVAPPRA
ncbi:MAG: hypothetical protein SF051_13795 [Elusimicrobiota bacterium]|nr:hypothetical protein [Elusimicrobiota bacterium]